jgi:hypothetical protein
MWAQARGWDACVNLTPSALKFADPALLAGIPCEDYKRPEEPDVLPRITPPFRGSHPVPGSPALAGHASAVTPPAR